MCIRDSRRIVQYGVSHDHAGLRLTVRGVQRNRRERDRLAARPAHVELQRIAAQHLKAQSLALFLQQVERTAIGVQQSLGCDQDGFQQLGVIAFPGQGNANPVELFQTLR